MEIGMLWYDDDHKRALGERVARAVEHYKTKYGAVPTVCFVNPAMLPDGPETAAGVQLRSARNVMRDHFWIGVAEGPSPNGKSGGRHAGPNGNGRHNGRSRAAKASSAG